MKKKILCGIKNILWLAVFAAALFVVVRSVLSVLEWKDGYGLKTWDEFYGIEKDTVDVLCYGSSHNMCTINHGLLWNEHGITSASAGGIGLSLRTTYYFIRETLNYQRPKVILLEAAYATWDSEEYTGYEEVMALNQSLDRAALVKELYEDDEDYMSYLLRLPVYHTRYWEIGKKDFTGFDVYSLGYYGTWNIYSGGTPKDLSATAQPMKIEEEKLKWLDEIIRLCNDENIKLVIYVAPFNAACTQEDWDRLDWVEQYAKELGIPMLNFNKKVEELQLDFTTDYADNHHLNVYGGEKVTAYIGNYLAENYDLEDHRGQGGYGLWENCYKRYLHEENMYRLKWEQSMENYLALLEGNDFVTAFTFKGEDYIKVMEDKHFELFERLGVKPEVLRKLGEGILIVSAGEVLYKTGDTDSLYCFNRDGCDFWVRIGDDGSEELIVDGFNCTYRENGIHAVTYSRISGQSVENVFFSPYNGFMRTVESEEDD